MDRSNTKGAIIVSPKNDLFFALIPFFFVKTNVIIFVHILAMCCPEDSR